MKPIMRYYHPEIHLYFDHYYLPRLHSLKSAFQIFTIKCLRFLSDDSHSLTVIALLQR